MPKGTINIPSKQKKLSRQMLVFFLAIALIPLAIVSIIYLLTTRNILLETESKYLKISAKRQIHEIQNDLNKNNDFAFLVSKSPNVLNLLDSFQNMNSANLAKSFNNPKNAKIRQELKPSLNAIIKRFKFKQLYLINNNGIVVSSQPSIDLHDRDLNQKFKKPSELKRIYLQTIKSLTPQMSDFHTFDPKAVSSLFITEPVFKDGKLLGAIALELNNQELNNKLSHLTPMGETGEMVFAIKKADHLSYLVIIVAGITTIIVIVVALLLSRSMTKPLSQLTHAANQLANGDLTGEISCKSRNEVGELAKATRIISQSLKSLVSKVKASGFEISNTTEFLTNSTQNQLTATERTDKAAINAKKSAKDISQTANQLAHTMTDVNAVTQKTALKAESGLDVLFTIEASMKRLSTANSSVSDQLALIQEKANAITSVIVTMTKVADQTNLLSLNAAIEARKAGKYGRGFTIVATEIQRLADQAATSTLEIERSVRDMLGAVRTGVSGMQNFSEQVTQSVKEITQISSRLSEVIQQVQGLPPRFDQILDGMNSQTDGAKVINQSMRELTNSAQQTATAVKETQRMLDNLQHSAHILEDEISRFKT